MRVEISAQLVWPGCGSTTTLRRIAPISQEIHTLAAQLLARNSAPAGAGLRQRQDCSAASASTRSSSRCASRGCGGGRRRVRRARGSWQRSRLGPVPVHRLVRNGSSPGRASRGRVSPRLPSRPGETGHVPSQVFVVRFKRANGSALRHCYHSTRQSDAVGRVSNLLMASETV